MKRNEGTSDAKLVKTTTFSRAPAENRPIYLPPLHRRRAARRRTTSRRDQGVVRRSAPGIRRDTRAKRSAAETDRGDFTVERCDANIAHERLRPLSNKRSMDARSRDKRRDRISTSPPKRPDFALAGCSEFSAPQPAVSGTDGGAARSAKRAARRNASATATKVGFAGCRMGRQNSRQCGDCRRHERGSQHRQRCRSDYAPFWSSRSDELRRSLASSRARRRPARPNRKIAGTRVWPAQGPIERLMRA